MERSHRIPYSWKLVALFFRRKRVLLLCVDLNTSRMDVPLAECISRGTGWEQSRRTPMVVAVKVRVLSRQETVLGMKFLQRH